MKKMKYLQIASLLICLLMLVVGCAEEPVELPEKIEDEAPVTVTADPIRSNFITFEYKGSEKLNVGESLCEKYGEHVSSVGDLILFKKSEKDYMNNLTETYTVYSISEAKEVKSIAHTYADEDYTRLDDFGNVVRPEKTVSVSIKTLKEYAADYIRVITTTYSPIDEEKIEKGDLDDSYSASYNIEFYDAKGTQISTTKSSVEGRLIEDGDFEIKGAFGKTVAIFDIEENKIVKTYDGDTNSESVNCSFSNEKYDYYFNVGYGLVDYNHAIGGLCKIQVFDKKGNQVLDYTCSEYSTYNMPYVIANGDIAIQYLTLTDEIEYDILLNNQKINVDTFIIDVETGSVKQVENFNYMIDDFMTKDDKNSYELFSDDVTVTFNETNVRNIARAQKFENGILSEKNDIIFVDDLLNVNYVFEKYCEEQTSNTEFRFLEGGYMYVNIDGPIAGSAIVKDGKVVTYVTDDMMVTKYGIITNDGIYNFKMEKIRTIDEMYTQYTYITSVGSYAVFSYVEVLSPDQILAGSIADYGLYFIDMQNGSTYRENDTVIDTAVGISDDFIVTKNMTTGKEKLMNADLQTMFIADDIFVEDCKGTCIAITLIDGNKYVFTLTPNSVYDKV